MPIHDWSRVIAGTFHHFHQGWITRIGDALNDGLLPPDFYAMAEQFTGKVEPDVVTLQGANLDDSSDLDAFPGAIAVASAPPKTLLTATTELSFYARKQDALVIRHASDDRVVALVEVLSPGNKGSRREFNRFLKKAISALNQGIHLLLIDLIPPSRRDPQGIHVALWSDIGDDEPQGVPPGKPLTLAAYVADAEVVAYVEPIAVGDDLPEMPLFLDAEHYVKVPLQPTYAATFAIVPKKWRDVLERA